mmetsp:Transcript_18340/g.42279  ORF Transcript_18340/g.42279 Transcript_18340/m.42279 type:complete len:82 (+) Transcript_18340:642-887(+)
MSHQSPIDLSYSRIVTPPKLTSGLRFLDRFLNVLIISPRASFRDVPTVLGQASSVDDAVDESVAENVVVGCLKTSWGDISG